MPSLVPATAATGTLAAAAADVVATGAPLYPSDSLYPSNTLYPSGGSIAGFTPQNPESGTLAPA